MVNGTWCDRQLPSAGLPSTVFGPLHPFGLRRMIIGQRGSNPPCPARACCWIRRIASNARSIAAASAWCIAAGSEPATSIGS